MQEDGFFRIVDRKKDMILVSGFNVYPNEIEEVVCSHAKVLECAAIGQPDEKSGEVVKIFVVKKDNTLTDAELLAHCRENLTAYKIPKAGRISLRTAQNQCGQNIEKGTEVKIICFEKILLRKMQPDKLHLSGCYVIWLIWHKN